MINNLKLSHVRLSMKSEPIAHIPTHQQHPCLFIINTVTPPIGLLARLFLIKVGCNQEHDRKQSTTVAAPTKLFFNTHIDTLILINTGHNHPPPLSLFHSNIAEHSIGSVVILNRITPISPKGAVHCIESIERLFPID